MQPGRGLLCARCRVLSMHLLLFGGGGRRGARRRRLSMRKKRRNWYTIVVHRTAWSRPERGRCGRLGKKRRDKTVEFCKKTKQHSQMFLIHLTSSIFAPHPSTGTVFWRDDWPMEARKSERSWLFVEWPFPSHDSDIGRIFGNERTPRLERVNARGWSTLRPCSK